MSRQAKRSAAERQAVAGCLEALQNRSEYMQRYAVTMQYLALFSCHRDLAGRQMPSGVGVEIEFVRLVPFNTTPRSNPERI
jgi:hypothetical protein